MNNINVKIFLLQKRNTEKIISFLFSFLSQPCTHHTKAASSSRRLLLLKVCSIFIRRATYVALHWTNLNIETPSFLYFPVLLFIVMRCNG